MDNIRLTHERLSIDEATHLVTAPTCGAISIFVGTTRDNFDDKKVVQLEYEAYDSMAEKVMKELCVEIRKKWTVENIVIFHRLGIVPVCEASVIIAVSSEHRGEALAAVQHAINALKASVPIWKKEVYDEASGSKPQWKENKESAVPVAAMEVEIDEVKKQKPKLDETDVVPSHLIQIKATPEEVGQRISAFIARKREDVNRINIRDFCTKSYDTNEMELNKDSCARVDAVLVPRKDSKSHLRVRRVCNTWGPQTRGIDPGSVPMSYFKVKKEPIEPVNSKLPPSIEERLLNIEGHLKLSTKGPVPPDIYSRLKSAEEKILYLESISPEYFTSTILNDGDGEPAPKNNSKPAKKKVYSAVELMRKLQQLERQNDS